MEKLPTEILHKIFSYLPRRHLEVLQEVFKPNQRLDNIVSRYIVDNRPQKTTSIKICGKTKQLPVVHSEYSILIERELGCKEIIIYHKRSASFFSGHPTQYGVAGDMAYFCYVDASLTMRISVFCDEPFKTLRYAILSEIDQTFVPNLKFQDLVLNSCLVELFKDWKKITDPMILSLNLTSMDLREEPGIFCEFISMIRPNVLFVRDPVIRDGLSISSIYSRKFFSDSAVMRCSLVHLTDVGNWRFTNIIQSMAEFIINGNWVNLHISYEVVLTHIPIMRVLAKWNAGEKDIHNMTLALSSNAVAMSIVRAIENSITSDQLKIDESYTTTSDMTRFINVNNKCLYVRVTPFSFTANVYHM